MELTETEIDLLETWHMGESDLDLHDYMEKHADWSYMKTEQWIVISARDGRF